MCVCVCAYLFCSNDSTAAVMTSAAATVVEEVYENQRRAFPLSSTWKPPFLPTDRHQWTNVSGEARGMEDVNRGLPVGWVWASEWRVDARPPLGADGWDYDVDFNWFGSRGRTPNPSPSMGHSVRQRRFVRERRRAVTDAAPLSGNTAVCVCVSACASVCVSVSMCVQR